MSAAHHDSCGNPIPVGQLILYLVTDVGERGEEGAEVTNPGSTIHLGVPIEVDQVVGGEQVADRVKILIVECREKAPDNGLVLLVGHRVSSFRMDT
jgi:hypothetical protein